MFDQTITSLNAQLVNGETTAVQLVEDCLARIEATNGELNAFITVTREEALEQAKASDEKGYSADRPLQGIPLGLKDNISTKDVKTTAASLMLADFVPIYDAAVVEKLQEAGAILVGKLNMDEFATGSTTENSYFGATKNPWDYSKVPGGSSGGSASAVAAGQVVAALGTDTGGSIRQPAALNGLVGMKPTYGRVSRYGVIAFGSSLDQTGPLTRNVKDNALVLEALAGKDNRDATSVDGLEADFTSNLEAGVQGLKIAVPSEYLVDHLSDDVRQATERAIETFRELGAIVEEVSMPQAKNAVPAYYILSSVEAASNLSRFDGVRYGYRPEGIKDLDDLYLRSRSEGFGPEVKNRIMLGTFAVSADNYETYYDKATRVRQLIREEYDAIFANYDFILSPTAITTARPLGSEDEDAGATYDADVLTVGANLAGVPAISLPNGFGSDNMPIGVQLQANNFEEAKLYQAAYAFEQANDFLSKHPDVKGAL